MKYSRFCKKISLALICTGLLLSSCDKSPKMTFPHEDIIFDASGIDTMTIQISGNGSWTASVNQKGGWLTVKPKQGNGGETIKLIADENEEFSDRITYVTISGDGMKTDSIKVIQTATIDVAEKITDEEFRKYCLYLFDESQDGMISVREAKSVNDKIVIDEKGNEKSISRTKMIFKDYQAFEKQIVSLVGIEYFTKIRELNCENHQIEEIDVSKNKELRFLNCSYNQKIDKIEVGELARLSSLKVYNTNIKNVDVSKNEALSELWISNNSITSINVSNNKELYLLQCNNNLLTNLDVSKNTKLANLYCSNNKLTKLDVGSNTNLVTLYCNENLLASLDVSNNKILQILWCASQFRGEVNEEEKGIASLQLANNTNLTQLRCDNNILSSLEISHNTRLEHLYCSSNKLRNTLDISNNKELRYIDLQTNVELTTIQVWKGFDKLNENYKKDSHANWVEK